MSRDQKKGDQHQQEWQEQPQQRLEDVVINLWNLFNNTYGSSSRFYSKLINSFVDAYLISAKTLSEIRSPNNMQDIEKTITSKIRERFDDNFRQDDFVRSLSDLINNYSNLAGATGFNQLYQFISNISSIWNNTFVEPLRDTIWRTPSHKIYSEGKFSLYHYKHMHEGKKDNSNGTITNNSITGRNKEHTSYDDSTDEAKTPTLIIYALINRHYILDLLPDVSIVRNFQRQGFDIFATDWGTPGVYDNELTLGHYVNNYLDNSIEQIRKHTNSDKVSLFGYCWGGDLALMYAALHPEKVKNIITLATPGDFSLDNELISVWTKGTNADSLVDSFGNVPSILLNSAFALRSPMDYIHKYPHFFEKPRDLQSIMEFLATEMWLNDSLPIIGEIYRQFVKDCYQNNLLIKNQLKIGGGKDGMLIDLTNNIKMPFLNVVAASDDLVSPASSKALNNVVGSSDKTMIEFQSGHVGACIGSRAHKELWPKVGIWLKDRS